MSKNHISLLISPKSERLIVGSALPGLRRVRVAERSAGRLPAGKVALPNRHGPKVFLRRGYGRTGRLLGGGRSHGMQLHFGVDFPHGLLFAGWTVVVRLHHQPFGHRPFVSIGLALAPDASGPERTIHLSVASFRQVRGDPVGHHQLLRYHSWDGGTSHCKKPHCKCKTFVFVFCESTKFTTIFKIRGFF